MLACCFCLPFCVAHFFGNVLRFSRCPLSFFLALVAQIFFLVFCFGPTPFGKLMRKFLVKCEISRYFSKHTHSHTQEASECACVCDGFLSVCKLATTARCLFDAACPRSCLSTCLCRLIDGYYAHLYSDLSRTPCTAHHAPFPPLCLLPVI